MTPDFGEHIETYKGFITGVRYFALVHIMVASFAIFYFFTRAGWAAGAVVAAIELAGGALLIARARRAAPEQ